ncbi:MAG: putative hydro-lyase [Oscillospiraceae bacterium]|nr:putative hydro-lyase [Oscillospiraceae bacterium]
MKNPYASTAPAEVRALIRAQKITGQTSGMCEGFAQANLIVLPYKYAYDFLLFAQRNPKSCPVLEVSEPGDRLLRRIAQTDIATDIPKYRIYENGVLAAEVTDASAYWREDLVSFLIGCSFSFEGELLEAGVSVRHIEQNRNVPMYLTNLPCDPAGALHGNLVVSMRPLPPEQIVRAVTATAAMPRVHGAPVHIGDPAQIGIADLAKPDFGEAVTVNPGETPVFWACGVTPQAVVMASKPTFAITHAPGHMLITDQRNVLLKD